MLVSANQLEPSGGMGKLAEKARRARRSGVLSEPGLSNGMGISPLRATSPPAGAFTGSLMVRPPEDGYGVLSQLQGQVLSANLLYGALATRSLRGDGTLPSLGVLQASLVKARQDFLKIDAGSRFLQATRSPLRSQDGFGLRLLTSSLDLLG